MRPVDRLLAAPHAFFDATFDNHAGAPLLVIADYTWNAALGNAVYTYFRNGQTWTGNTTPQQPVSVQNNGTTHFMGPANVIPAQNLGMVDRANTGNLSINAQILRLQIDKPQQRWMRLRVAVPPGEAADLARAWQDGTWNGAAPATIPNAIRDHVWGLVSSTGTVPNNPDPPGTYYGYRGAVRDLESALGGYCSYCESKRQDGNTHDVEHRLAKASYQSEILRWDNFLLGCIVCNERFKREQPDREFGIRKAITAYHPAAGIVYAGGDQSPIIPPTANRIPYFEMRQASNDYHAWPSLDDGGAGAPVPAANAANPTNYSLLCFSYRLRQYNLAGAAVGWVPPADAVHLDNNVIGDGPNNTVSANVWNSTLGPPALQQMYVRVEVEPRSPNTGNVAFDNRKLAAATSTETMVGLNGVTNAYGDRRMVERTHTWFRAIENLRLLRDQIALVNDWNNSWLFRYLFHGPPPPNFTTDQWTLVASAAEAGYYSVWLTVFKQFGNNLAVTLAQTLDNRATANTLYRYKGTNLVNSVTNMIPNL